MLHADCSVFVRAGVQCLYSALYLRRSCETISHVWDLLSLQPLIRPLHCESVQSARCAHSPVEADYIALVLYLLRSGHCIRGMIRQIVDICRPISILGQFLVYASLVALSKSPSRQSQRLPHS